MTANSERLRDLRTGMSLNVCAARAATGLSQALFAKRFGIAIGTLRDWEQGRKRPDGPARALLKVIESRPDFVEQILNVDGDKEGPSESNPLNGLVEQWRAERPEEDLIDFQFRALITLIARSIENEFRSLCRNHLHITEGEMRILFTLRRSRAPLRQTTLVRSLLLTSGGVTKQVQRLERRQLVQCKRNRQGVWVRLTDKGNQVVNQALTRQAVGFYFSSAAFKRLSDKERAVGVRFLRQILAGVMEARS